MKSNIFANIEYDIINVNDFAVEGQVDTRDVAHTSSVFGKLNLKREINITQSGKYTFISNECNNRHVVINVLPNLDVTIIDSSNKLNENNDVQDLEVNVAESSKLYYLNIDQVNRAFIKRTVNIAKDADVKFHVIGLNNAVVKNYFTFELNEEGANVDFKLITVAANDSHNVYECYVNNNAPRTTGNIWQKAVCTSGGKNDFIATGFIDKGCDDASNFQESRVLLLDDAALGNATPILLIEHFNVVAGHAAGVSRVNEEELYYLQSRGIDKQSAEHLMTIAFVSPLIDEIPFEHIQEEILKDIEEKIFVRK